MDFVPGSQQSIESMHLVKHVRTADRIGDQVYISCKGENSPQTMDIGCVKQFGLQNGLQAVKVQWLCSPGMEIPMRDYYGEKGLFQSKHHNIVPETSLNGKCDVKYNVADHIDVLRRPIPGMHDIAVASPSMLMGACQQRSFQQM